MSLRSLGGGVTPPPHLKSRVLADLRERGLLSPRLRRWRPLAAAMAAFALFGAGYGAGRASSAPTTPASLAPRYALLLFEDRGFDRSLAESALVAEYGAWAGQLAAAGHDVGGEKLGDEVGIVPEENPNGLGRLTGFFILSAESDSAALALAHGSPHRRHGGRVVVRRVDPT